MNDIKVLHALADPTRRALFERIVQAPRSVGELAGWAPVSQPAVSQHLKVLRAARLVDVESRGALRIYRARADGVQALMRWLDTCLQQIGPKANA
ncbi:MAG: metalloregulator ArsR/SmtB family transcription factor [Acidobacteria bacterium]|nr:metalloregulator ArsR/SmtB family transcription factor [Acidobacteriota bacterium]